MTIAADGPGAAKHAHSHHQSLVYLVRPEKSGVEHVAGKYRYGHNDNDGGQGDHTGDVFDPADDGIYWFEYLFHTHSSLLL